MKERPDKQQWTLREASFQIMIIILMRRHVTHCNRWHYYQFHCILLFVNKSRFNSFSDTIISTNEKVGLTFLHTLYIDV